MFMHANYDEEINYVMLLLCKMTLCLNPLWTSRF